ncbi:MAG: carboxypeptidase-like regulatory domain-containing protein, partial [Tannerella sp.]|nr:carboxypeptidase-like regulatory domain-containing protein [Tannerella sp.]
MECIFSKRELLPNKRKWIIMMITTVCLIIGLIPAYADDYAHDTKLTVNENGIELEKLLSRIEAATEFFFFYSNDEIDRNMKVNVNVKEKPITDVLDQALSGSDITYQVKDRVIILAHKNTLLAIEQHPAVAGTVTDQNGDPLPGVNISIKGTTTGVISDAEGKYSLNVPNEKAVIVYSYIGYVTQEITVGNQTKIDVTLRENTLALEEVVVVGYGTQKKVNLTG